VRVKLIDVINAQCSLNASRHIDMNISLSILLIDQVHNEREISVSWLKVVIIAKYEESGQIN
jgi:hypothetical protein